MPTFHDNIRRFVVDELESARRADAKGDRALAFTHLERAHILGQRSTRLHLLVHLKMLLWGYRYGECREVFGQLWRLIAAGMTTHFGLLPSGNTGGSNVSGFKAMPVPADLKARIDAAG